jgi:hypothetical protein
MILDKVKTQLMIYGMLKIILKEIISQHEEISELLCSYFLKTTLFWVIEETQATHCCTFPGPI